MFACFVLTPTFLGGFNLAQLGEFSFATRADWVQRCGNRCFHRGGICRRGRVCCGRLCNGRGIFSTADTICSWRIWCGCIWFPQAFLQGANTGGALLCGQLVIGFGRCGLGRSMLWGWCRRLGDRCCGHPMRRGGCALATNLNLDGTACATCGARAHLSGVNTAKGQLTARQAEFF
jgi:hypothetical protein